MMVEVDCLKAGDRMRFSTELLEQIDRDPYHQGVIVEIVKIHEDVLDGTKTVWLKRVTTKEKR